ncbi:MAG: hypothetical protein Q9184_003739 [Pyrenodesmia sp. 2 TL-2023]
MRSQKATRAWDGKGHMVRSGYDAAGRSIRTFVTGDTLNGENPQKETLIQRVLHGEVYPQAESRNLRGSTYLSLDQSGALTIEQHDFQVKLTGKTLRLSKDKKMVDWRVVDNVIRLDPSATVHLSELEAALGTKFESGTFESSNTYDAINRILTSTTPQTEHRTHTVQS